MQTTEYGIPIFEDTDRADLNQYSTDMAKALKTQFDKFGNPLIFKGNVASVSELPTEGTSGWIYNVTGENKNYIYNGTEWVIYSDNFDTSNLVNQEEIKDNLVVVSPTEPTGDNREKVWIQKGKNLYNPKYAYVAGDLSQDAELKYKDIKSGQTYTFKSNHTWTTIKTYNKSNELIRQIGATENADNLSITISEEEKYVLLLFNTGFTGLSSLKDVDFTGVQLEQGTVATEYQEYIEPKIYVKNDNDVYEEFISKEDILERYSTGEQKIGTWIDGKPLYRKVINFGALPNATTKTINTGLTNVNYIKIYGMACNQSIYFPLNVARPISGNNLGLGCWISNNEITIESASDRSSYNAHIILEYTKTTD